MSLENQVSRDTPETFIWHTMEDTTVLPYNSICFVQALAKYGIPAEYHLFLEGYHGIGLGNELTANEDGRGIIRGCEEWSSLCEKWLNRRFPWWNPGV
ncbi:MAG: prolyl oligopeptidase family serine peptidase [Blautia caecimuris]